MTSDPQAPPNGADPADEEGGNGEAKAADFLALMRTVRAEVKARQGVELRPEIVALGREWKELL